jgi:hypothetical protein
MSFAPGGRWRVAPLSLTWDHRDSDDLERHGSHLETSAMATCITAGLATVSRPVFTSDSGALTFAQPEAPAEVEEEDEEEEFGGSGGHSSSGGWMR